MATYYLVHHPVGDSVREPQRFSRFEDARTRAFLLSRMTGRGVSVTRHPKPYDCSRIFVAMPHDCTCYDSVGT